MIEKVVPAFVDNNVRFTLRDITPHKLIRYRRANRACTHMFWITQSVKWDKYLHEFYNPKTCILIWIN